MTITGTTHGGSKFEATVEFWRYFMLESADKNCFQVTRLSRVPRCNTVIAKSYPNMQPVVQEVLWRAAAKMNQLTVKLSELLFVQRFIALVGGARADFQQPQHRADSRHGTDGAAATPELHYHCCAKLLSWGDRVAEMRGGSSKAVFEPRPRPAAYVTHSLGQLLSLVGTQSRFIFR